MAALLPRYHVTILDDSTEIALAVVPVTSDMWFCFTYRPGDTPSYVSPNHGGITFAFCRNYRLRQGAFDAASAKYVRAQFLFFNHREHAGATELAIAAFIASLEGDEKKLAATTEFNICDYRCVFQQ